MNVESVLALQGTDKLDIVTTIANMPVTLHYSIVIQYRIKQFIDGDTRYTKCTVSQNTTHLILLLLVLFLFVAILLE